MASDLWGRGPSPSPRTWQAGPEAQFEQEAAAVGPASAYLQLAIASRSQRRTGQRRVRCPSKGQQEQPHGVVLEKSSTHLQSEVAYERTYGMPCNLRVASENTSAQNSAVEEAICIARQEEAEWQPKRAIQAAAGAAVTAAATAATIAWGAAAAHQKCMAEEAIAIKNAELRALEEALAREKEKQVVDEKTTMKLFMSAQKDTAT